MKSYDVIFIHPPRTLKPHYGDNARIPRTSFIFLPMGVFAIADYLETEGFGVQIINYPLEQYLNRDWSLSEYLKTIDFNVCGIDLHWLHNSHAAIEVAKIVKKINPNAKVVLGGYSATYYHDQILKYFNMIDGIIRGDGEIPLLKYVQSLKQNSLFDSIPNLSYRNSSKHIKINDLTYTAQTLDHLNFTNIELLKNAKHYIDCSRRMMGISFNLPVGRGCPFNCPYCAGGQRAQERLAGRTKVTLRKPENVVEDINIMLEKYNIQSIFFGHGAYPASLKYWKKLLRLIQKEDIDIGGDLEIWRLPFPKEMWRQFYRTFRRRYSSISISPRTMSARVQQKIAKICDPTFNFPKKQINDLIRNANLFQRTLRIWLTIGFPFQTRLDAQKDFIFSLKCMFKYGKSISKPITLMNEPYHIFPGSPAFESPESFRIKLKYNSFPEVTDFFKRTKMSFFYNAINYDTEVFSGTSIRNANILLFLSSALNHITTGSKLPETRVKNIPTSNRNS
ncbi:MAG: cobalamin-dependent protein [Promethearchaeota archaeon]